MLRSILSRYVNQRPEALMFTSGRHGNPFSSRSAWSFGKRGIRSVTLRRVGFDCDCSPSRSRRRPRADSPQCGDS